MRYALLSSTTVLFLTLTSCCRHEDIITFLDDKNISWIPDTLYQDFTMKNSQGDCESFKATNSRVVNNTHSDSQCSSLTSQYSTMYFNSTFAKICSFHLSSMPEGDYLTIAFGDIHCAVNLSIIKGIPSAGNTGTYTSTPLYHEHYSTETATYYNVIEMNMNDQISKMNDADAKTIFIAKHYGIIKYIQKDGLVWIRQNSFQQQ